MNYLVLLFLFGLLYYCNSTGPPQKFNHPSITASLNCAEILENSSYELGSEKRITYEDDNTLEMDREAIHKRNYFPMNASSEEESDFPIAYARAVFKDYLFLESELAATYASQNWYCFAMDNKSDEIFHNRIKTLASHFSNVVVTSQEWPMDSAGHNMTLSLLECMKELTKPEMKWNYLILLQNHDMALKSNEELVQIFKWFDGANDIEITHAPGHVVNHSLDWTFQHLELLRNESHKKAGYPEKLQFAKGSVEGTLSRATVEFIVNELDMTIMLAQLETMPYGIDEIPIQTLMTTDAIDMPAGFTHACLDKDISTPFATRYSHMVPNKIPCRSGHKRHYSCIFGLEYLVAFKESSYLFANKVLPQFDMGAINCWHETMFNRTYLDRGTHRLNETIYKELPLVRYHAEKKKNGVVDMDKFDCNYVSLVEENAAFRTLWTLPSPVIAFSMILFCSFW